MTAVDPRTLKSGQRARLTLKVIEGVVTDEHQGILSIESSDGVLHGFRVDEIDTVELLAPPLPTEVGTTILAVIPSRWTIPVIAVLAQINGGLSTGWVMADGRILDPTTITEWRLLDGLDTVRVPEPEAPPAPAREERPCEGCDNAVTGCLTPCKPLPTGLGAVIRAMRNGGEIVAVRADRSSAPWYSHTRDDWYSDDGIRVTEVLSPGIEIPSPTTPEEG